MTSVNAIASQLESILSPSSIVPCDRLSGGAAYPRQGLQQQAQLERTLGGSLPQCWVYPRTPAELAEVIKLAKNNHWRILPCGRGSKLHWGGLAEKIDLVVSTEQINQLVEHAVGDLTVTVEAGMAFAQLQAILAASGQFLALDPAYPEQATMGGIVATADTGSWRHRYGGVRDRLIGFSFVRSDGEIVKAGGRVVKNVAGYDLMKLFIGSYGTLGIISQVTLRVYPWPEVSETVVLTGKAELIEQATRTLLASALTPTAADLIADGAKMQLVVRFQSVPEAVKQQSARLLEVASALGLQGDVWADEDEKNLWQRLQNRIWETASTPTVICKIGVRPTEAINILRFLAQWSATTTIHAKTGLGLLRLGEIQPQDVMEVRSHLVANGGFLTLLEAPVELKQQLDVWGYPGNALELMRQIKQQFDPDHLLSPQRFVGKI